VITAIIENGFYKDPSDLSLLIENMLRNTMPETRPDILRGIVKLYLLIIKFEGADKQLKGLLGPEAICSLLSGADDDIVDCSLRILAVLSTDKSVRERTAAIFFEALPHVIDRRPINNSLISKGFSLLSTYLGDSDSCEKIGESEKFVPSFQSYIKVADDGLIDALCVCYQLSLSKVTYNAVINLAPEFFKLMMSSDFVIAATASMCVVSLLCHSSEPETLVNRSDSSVRQFMGYHLNMESKCTPAALCLAGVLTKKTETASLIGSWRIQPLIVRLLNSSDPRIISGCLKQILAMSAILPDMEGLSGSIETLFALCEFGKYGRYPTLCIANLSVIPENAVIAGKFLSTILKLIASDGDSVEGGIMILYRVAIVPESSVLMDQREMAEKLLETIEKGWRTWNCSMTYAMLMRLVGLPVAVEVMRRRGFLGLVNERLGEVALDDIDRPALIRIRACLARVK
jgi:hypothetical protein